MGAVVQIEVRLDDKGVIAGVQNIEGGLQKVGQRGNLVFTEMSRQQKQARDATQLLGNSLGVQLPREIEKLIAKSSLIGPLMSAAFSATVVVAFGAAVVALIPQIADAASSVGGFTKAMRELEPAARDANRALLIALGAKGLPETNAQILALEKQREELAKTRDTWQALAIVSGVAAPQALAKYAQAAMEFNQVNDRLVALGVLRDEQISAETKRLKELVTATNTHAAAVRGLTQAQLEQIQFTARLEAGRSFEKDQADAAKAATEALITHGQRVIEINSAIIQVERETAIKRAEANGDFVEAARLQEQFRVDDAIAKMQALVEAEKGSSAQRAELEAKLAQFKAALSQQSNIKILGGEQQRNDQIIQENQRMVDQLAGSMESLWDSLWGGGNIAQNALRMVKRFFFQILAQWLLTLGGMRSAGAGVGGGGGILGSLLGGLFGLGGGSSVGTVQPTPPFFGAFGGGGSNDFISQFQPSALTSLSTGAAPLTTGLPSAGGGVRGAPPGLGGSGGVGRGGGGLLQLLLGRTGSSILPQLLGGITGLLGGPLTGFQSANPILGGIFGAVGGGLGGSILGGLAFGAAGGPIGLVVGAIVGLVAGVLGGIFGRKKRSARAFKEARAIWFEAKKQIEETVKAYKDHQLGFDDALKQLDDIRSETADALIQATAFDRHSKWGKRYIKDRLDPAVKDAKETIQKIETERQARGQTVFGPPQFHAGGMVPGSGGEVLALLRRGEFVVNEFAAGQHRQLLEAINQNSMLRRHSGGAVSPGRTLQAAVELGPEPLHIHIHAIDSADVGDWLRNRGGLRIIGQEMNRSLREYNPSA